MDVHTINDDIRRNALDRRLILSASAVSTIAKRDEAVLNARRRQRARYFECKQSPLACRIGGLERRLRVRRDDLGESTTERRRDALAVGGKRIIGRVASHGDPACPATACGQDKVANVRRARGEQYDI